MIVKVCGMREPHNIRAVESAGADWMGFILYPRSPRYVDRRPDCLPVRARRIGVFVDAAATEIAVRTEEFGLHAVQLHGHESPEFCTALRGTLPDGTLLIKALHIACTGDMRRAAEYEDVCDYLLFEPPSDTYGGSGKRFDWSLLDNYRGSLPFILSGGIGPDAAEALAALHHPRWAGVDLNSRFETAPAVKDAELLKEFIHKIKFKI